MVKTWLKAYKTVALVTKCPLSPTHSYRAQEICSVHSNTGCPPNSLPALQLLQQELRGLLLVLLQKVSFREGYRLGTHSIWQGNGVTLKAELIEHLKLSLPAQLYLLYPTVKTLTEKCSSCFRGWRFPGFEVQSECRPSKFNAKKFTVLLDLSSLFRQTYFSTYACEN